jgi:uncharacterized protein
MSFSFEWDPDKAARNLAKHRVSFAEAETVFMDTLGVELPNPDHSLDEERMILIGRSYRGRLLLVVFTELEDSMRIISARLATRHERRTYEEGA